MLKLIAMLSFAVTAHMAWADCSSPAGKEGTMIYNADYRMMQFCDGTNWIAMGGSSSVSSAKQCYSTYPTTYNGNRGGISGANAICEAAFGSGWTMGTSAKITVYRPAGWIPSLYHWVADASPNCSNWTSSSSGVNGKAVYSTGGNYYDDAYSMACNNSYAIICCSF